MTEINFESFVSDSLEFFQEVKREIEATAPIRDGNYPYKRGEFVYHALDEVITGLEALSKESSPVSVEQLPISVFEGALPFVYFVGHSSRYLAEVSDAVEKSGENWEQLNETLDTMAKFKEIAIHAGPPNAFLDEEMAKAAYLTERADNPTTFMLATYVGNDLEVAYRSEANAINKIMRFGEELYDLSVDL